MYRLFFKKYKYLTARQKWMISLEDVIGLIIVTFISIAIISFLHGQTTTRGTADRAADDWIQDKVLEDEKIVQELKLQDEHRLTALEQKMEQNNQIIQWILAAIIPLGLKAGLDIVKSKKTAPTRILD